MVEFTFSMSNPLFDTAAEVKVVFVPFVPIWRVPPEMVVAPVRLLEPVRNRVPVPYLVIDPFPLMVPAKVWFAELLYWNWVVSVMLPE